jgi:hypothetical protein
MASPGEVSMAFVLRSTGSALSEAEARAHVTIARRCGPPPSPKPSRNLSGKIQRPGLRRI